MTLNTLKPMYTPTTAMKGTTAPRRPNCARDWIICGSPMRGPWLAWKAMKKVPMATPIRIASIEGNAPSPRAGPVKPVTRVVSTKLPVNQNGPWCQTLPWRSLRGT